MAGFSRAQIIEIANRRTERRGEKPLDLDAECLIALTQVCKETRWYWRRKMPSFNTAVGVADYDLTQITGYENIIPEKFVKNGVRLIEPGGQPASILCPLFDDEEQANALEATTPAKPSAYFMESGSIATLRLDVPADSIYKIRTVFWAVPFYNMDNLPEELPLIPPQLQDVVIARLEMQIFRYALGEGSPKYLAAEKEYEKWVAQADWAADFADGQVQEYGRQASGEAIQGGQN